MHGVRVIWDSYGVSPGFAWDFELGLIAMWHGVDEVEEYL